MWQRATWHDLGPTRPDWAKRLRQLPGTILRSPHVSHPEQAKRHRGSGGDLGICHGIEHILRPGPGLLSDCLEELKIITRYTVG